MPPGLAETPHRLHACECGLAWEGDADDRVIRDEIGKDLTEGEGIRVMPTSLPATTDHPVPVDLRADGVLWLINATVFHPRGFALAVRSDDGALVLLGDGVEPWTFTDTPDVHEAMRAVEALFTRTREANRD